MFRYNFALVQHHKWNLSDIENLIPWERDIYIDLLLQHVKEEEERQRAQQAKNRK
tara:strand:- start:596 stop:760 length:165 start_codon:yes stop_codon:yes gene_type:complete